MDSFVKSEVEALRNLKKLRVQRSLEKKEMIAKRNA
jgi:hypothetical protein